LDLLPPAETPEPAPVTDDPDPEALELYVAGRFGHWVAVVAFTEAHHAGTADGPRVTVPLWDRNLFGVPYAVNLGESRRRQFLDIIARRGTPSAEAVQAAERALGQGFRAGLEEAVEGENWGFEPKLAAALVVLVELGFVGLWSLWILVVSTVFRGGPLLRLFGIAVVTRTGDLAGRAQLLTRAAAVWLASLAGFAVIGVSVAPALAAESPPAIPWAAIVLLAIVPGVGLLWCVLDPERGPHDRIAATLLVPR
jgi:hypothetical protein